jgi:hypothetical protein
MIMNTSPVNTGAAGAVTAAVVTVIAALVKHFDIDLPADAQVSVAVGLVTAAHLLGQQISARVAKTAPSVVNPAIPAQ